MVSIMESNLDPRRELDQAERAALAPWIDYRPSPWWLAPSGSLLLGAMVLVWGERERLPFAAFVVLAVALVAGLGAWIGATVSSQGALPRLRQAPAEFVPVLRGYFIGAGVLAVLVAALYLVVDSRLAAAVTALGAWGGYVLYERRYDKAAEAVRKRLT